MSKVEELEAQGQATKSLDQSTRKVKKLPFYVQEKLLKEISPATLAAWYEHKKNEWALIPGLCSVLHTRLETNLPHVGHPELGKIARFIEVCVLRYKSLGKGLDGKVLDA
eukprot:5024731-Amphidinium_carterae.1